MTDDGITAFPADLMAQPEKCERRTINSRQEVFANHVVRGLSHAEAYRQAYNRPDVEPVLAANEGYKVAHRQGVKQRITELRFQLNRKVLLSLNDRLESLAEIIQNPGSTTLNRIRAIEAYSRILGDQAPERHEHTGPDGKPIAVSATASITVRPVTVREKVAALMAARAARNLPLPQEQAPALTAAAPALPGPN